MHCIVVACHIVSIAIVDCTILNFAAADVVFRCQRPRTATHMRMSSPSRGSGALASHLAPGCILCRLTACCCHDVTVLHYMGADTDAVWIRTHSMRPYRFLGRHFATGISRHRRCHILLTPDERSVIWGGGVTHVSSPRCATCLHWSTTPSHHGTASSEQMEKSRGSREKTRKM